MSTSWIKTEATLPLWRGLYAHDFLSKENEEKPGTRAGEEQDRKEILGCVEERTSLAQTS